MRNSRSQCSDKGLLLLLRAFLNFYPDIFGIATAAGYGCGTASRYLQQIYDFIA